MVGTVVLARPLLMLLFGAGYGEGAIAFRLLALATGVLFFHWSMSNVLVASHRVDLQAKVHALAAVINVALTLALIPASASWVPPLRRWRRRRQLVCVR